MTDNRNTESAAAPVGPSEPPSSMTTGALFNELERLRKFWHNAYAGIEITPAQAATVVAHGYELRHAFRLYREGSHVQRYAIMFHPPRVVRHGVNRYGVRVGTIDLDRSAVLGCVCETGAQPGALLAYTNPGEVEIAIQEIFGAPLLNGT